MGARWPTIVDRNNDMEDGPNEAQVKAQSTFAGGVTKPEDVNRTLAEKQEGEAGAQINKQEDIKGKEMHGDENGDSSPGAKSFSSVFRSNLSALSVSDFISIYCSQPI